jgi:hypothetical protein
MRRILSFLVLLVLAASGAAAQRIDNAEIVSFGVMQPSSKAKTITDATISTGQRADYEEAEVVEETSIIKPKNGMVFGAVVKFKGQAKGKSKTTKVRVVWLYPAPGLTNPATGEAKLRDEFDSTITIGNTSEFYWTLGDEWTQVPGKWTLQLWSGERRLAQQFFELVKQ